VVVGESKPSATGEQIPEDSTLRRHYQQAKQAAEQQAAPVAVVVETAQVTETPQAVEAVEVAEVVPAAVEVAEPVVVAECKPAQKSAIPEDSALRRHYLSQLSAEVAASLPAKPSDSSLKRHYEQLLAAKLADALK
jgi:predicted RND superfamily exporter protein